MKVAFLDRDGVLNKDIGYLHKVEDWVYTANCISGLLLLKNLGYKFILVTNQAGIAKGYYSIIDFNELTEWMVNDLRKHKIHFTEIYFCPHHVDGILPQYKRACKCRKPMPGMINRATLKYNIDLDNSILVGDKITDIMAGNAAGVGRCFLVDPTNTVSSNYGGSYAKAEDLYRVAKLISKSN